MRYSIVWAVALTLGACSGRPALPSTSPGPALTTLQVSVESAPATRPVDGVVEAIDGALLSAQTGGRITAIVHDVGGPVAAGAVLLNITALEQNATLHAAESALTGAQSALADASARYDRIQSLYDEHIAAKAQHEAALASRDRAQAEFAAAQSNLTHARENVAHTAVRAPFAGIVSSRVVELGERVAPGQPLIAIVSPKDLRVSFNVPASIAAAVRSRDEALVQTASGVIAVRHLTIFPEAGKDTSTFRARGLLPPGTALAPGTPVRVELPTGESDQVSVPDNTLVRRSEVVGVYVVDAAGVPSLRYVRPGHSDGSRTRILAGLHAGERIATDPAAAARRLAGPTP